MKRWLIPTLPIDRRLAGVIAAHRSKRLESPLGRLTWLADEKLLLAAGSLYWLTSRAFDPPRRRQANHLLLTVGATAVLPHLLKRVAAQERPDRVEIHGKRRGVPRSGKPFDAFPSGHAVHMGALAMALSRMFPRVRAAIWTAALAIALTRVVLLAHWLSDVAVGSAVGAGLESSSTISIAAPRSDGMSLVDRTKTALDESRMLMLGTQILLGFQYQAPFQDAFQAISAVEKAGALMVLGLTTLAAGLLIAPSARHRIVDDGAASLSLLRFVADMASATLPVLALAIGLDLGIAGVRIAGPGVGVASAAIGTAVPLLLWFGPVLLRRRKEETMPTSDEKTPLDAKIDYVLTEARVVLPGAQALLGFQLAIVLTHGFAELSASAKLVHGSALALIALAAALLIAPAAYHRLVYRGRSEPQFHRLASRLVLLATVFLAGGMAADAYVVALKITANAPLASWLAAGTAALLLGLWQIWPWCARRAGPRAEN